MLTPKQVDRSITREVSELTGNGTGRGTPSAGPAAVTGCSMRLTSDSLHDLAGPVNQIRTLTDMLIKRNKGKLDDDAEVMFRFLQNSVERLDTLLAGLKTYMQAVGTREAYRLSDGNDCLADALASIRSSIEQQSARVTHEPLPPLYGDRRQITRVFANLVENGIKFRSERQPDVHISVTREEDFWVFAVRDNGMGLDPRHSERIFSMFKRINNQAGPGAGIGLAIAKQIVEEHGGRIWVESQLGSGAVFYFTLPTDETV
ncbi:MAG TPA: ATP-binding protein [Bryobacteraceae bacterium]|nr:ATP-binding protein [Bryobacteraceae bacterium]